MPGTAGSTSCRPAHAGALRAASREARSASDLFPGLLAAALPVVAPAPTVGASATPAGGSGTAAAPLPLPNQIFGAQGALTAPPGQVPAPPAAPVVAAPVPATDQPEATPPAAPEAGAPDLVQATAPIPAGDTVLAALLPAGPKPAVTAAASPSGNAPAAAVVAQLQLDVTLATVLAAGQGGATAGLPAAADGAGSGGGSAAASVAPEGVRRQVAVQLLREIGPTPGEGRVTLRLDPPHLGRVDVKLELTGEVLTVTFTAQSPEVERALREGAGDLQRALAAGGGRWGEVRVRIDEAPEGGAGGGDQDETGSGRERRGDRRDPRQDD